MGADQVTRLRALLGVTQVQLAEMLGVHPMTVSTWEREVAVPTPYQVEFMGKLEAGAKKSGEGKAFFAEILKEGRLVLVGFLLFKAIEYLVSHKKANKKVRV